MTQNAGKAGSTGSSAGDTLELMSHHCGRLARLKPGLAWKSCVGAVAGWALLLQVLLAAPAALWMADVTQQFSLATGVICTGSAPGGREDRRQNPGDPTDHRVQHCRFCSLSTPPLAVAATAAFPAPRGTYRLAVVSAPLAPSIQAPRFSPYISRAPPGLV